jgi:hypothetical protein
LTDREFGNRPRRGFPFDARELRSDERPVETNFFGRMGSSLWRISIRVFGDKIVLHFLL